MKNKIYTILTLILTFNCELLLGNSNNKIVEQFEIANDFYNKNNFTEAKDIYLKILEEISLKEMYSAEIFYNIGNCYFRENKLGYALYYYELAKLVNSRDSDVKHNLKFVRKLTNNEESENILLKIYDYFTIGELSSILFLVNVLFFTFLILSFVLKFDYIKIIRNTFFVLFVVFVILFYGKYKDYTKIYGIVIEPSYVSSSPEENFNISAAVSITEGKKVIILSEKDNFYAVYLPLDNLQGWIKKDSVRIIKI